MKQGQIVYIVHTNTSDPTYILAVYTTKEEAEKHVDHVLRSEGWNYDIDWTGKSINEKFEPYIAIRAE